MSIHISSVIVAGWEIDMPSVTGMCAAATDMKRGGNPVIEFFCHCQSIMLQLLLE